jgi:hypothetical protein
MLLWISLVLATPYEDGVAALKEKRVEDAITALTLCTQATPSDANCWWELGWAWYVKQEWARVDACWQTVLKLQPDFPGAAQQLASVQALQAQKTAGEQAKAKAPATTAPLTAKGRTFRLRAVGDMMIGTDFPSGYLPPDGGKSTFAQVTSLLQDADVTFGNLEGPLCDGGETTKCKPDAAPGSCYAFRTPTSYAPTYKNAGFDVVSTANNHANDFGEECRLQTEATLTAQGILFSGRLGTVASWTQNGIKVALIGFATNPVSHNLVDETEAVRLVSELSGTHQVVIVSFHGGGEGSKAIHVPQGTETFYGENRGDLRSFTHKVVDAGADLVIGHGPHVLRGMEIYKERLIAYSLGNFATYGRFNLSGNQGIGAILDVTLDEQGRFIAGRVLGTRQQGEGIPVPDPANAAADLLRSLTASDFPTYGVVVAQDGTFGPRP